MTGRVSQDLKIAVIGAGIAGLSTALALSRRGFKNVTIFERAEQLTEVGAGIQLGPNAVRVLTELGLQDCLAHRSNAAAHGLMMDGKTAKVLAKLPFSQYSESVYGVPSYQILRADLHRILLDEVTAAGISIHVGKECIRAVDDLEGVQLEFADGDVYKAELLIAADGIRSQITDQIYPDYPIYFSGYVCWRGLIDRTELPESIAEDWFNAVSLWTGSDKHLVTYPVARSQKLNLVALAARERWDYPAPVQASSARDWCRAFDGWAPEVLSVIARAKEAQLWGLYERPALPGWSNNRCVLVGDAAHPMLPSLAQGAAQGIEDALCLADLLAPAPAHASAQGNIDLAAVGYQFYQQRYKRVERVQSSARWNINYFHRPEGPLRSIRNTAMRVAGPITTSLIARRYHWLYRD